MPYVFLGKYYKDFWTFELKYMAVYTLKQKCIVAD